MNNFERFLVMSVVGLMLAIPFMRMLGVALLILIAAFPFEQIGFLRYQPWIPAAFCLAVSVLCDCLCVRNRISKLVLCALASALVFLTAARELNSSLEVLGCVAKEMLRMPRRVYSCYEQPRPLLPSSFRDAVAEFLDRKKTHSMNIILRNRQLGDFACEVVCVGDEDVVDMRRSILDYYVPFAKADECQPPKFRRLLRRIGYVRHLPENYLRRLRFVFPGD